jgi:hypothetical protein
MHISPINTRKPSHTMLEEVKEDQLREQQTTDRRKAEYSRQEFN